MTTKAKYIPRYYDSHEYEGEEVSQSRLHFKAIEYLLAVLNWFFAGQRVGVVSGINFYYTPEFKEIPKSPDVAVVDGLETEGLEAQENPSYYINEHNPPPRVAFEISSEDNWDWDLRDKPPKYQRMGILEYFVFDPNQPSLWTKTWRQHKRLIGWRLDPGSGQYVQLDKDPAGRLWSEQLQSWLVVDGQYLRLYTADGQLRLMKEEAEAQRAELAEQQAQLERVRARAIQKRLETERARAEEERARAEKLAEMLRKLGKNPDELL